MPGRSLSVEQKGPSASNSAAGRRRHSDQVPVVSEGHGTVVERVAGTVDADAVDVMVATFDVQFEHVINTPFEEIPAEDGVGY